MSTAYIPDRGNIVWLDFNPQTGREQAGRRPALVLTRAAYNAKTGLLVACPITNQAKGYPFEVGLPDGFKVTGVVLADHVKSQDWRQRNATFAAQAPPEVVEQALDLLSSLFS